ncbi:mRNA turnover 4 [Quaeritorhiza haematococci]|nr:mRNA turnover 4 [Quaeritorhiza haematococci]
MPKSKRSKIVSLTKTQKKPGRERKDTLFTQIRECVETYAHIFVFSIDNMRTTFFKDVREEWKTNSRFFLGKNKVIAKALGLTPEEAYRDNLHLLAQKLEGQVGILFTNADVEQVKSYFSTFRSNDYARSGFIATETVTIPAGPVTRGPDAEKFPHNMEPQLRALGMPTKLVVGVVTLDRDYTICEEGDTLTPEQAQLLKHFYNQMAVFHVDLLYHWTDGTFTELEQ